MKVTNAQIIEDVKAQAARNRVRELKANADARKIRRDAAEKADKLNDPVPLPKLIL